MGIYSIKISLQVYPDGYLVPQCLMIARYNSPRLWLSPRWWSVCERVDESNFVLPCFRSFEELEKLQNGCQGRHVRMPTPSSWRRHLSINNCKNSFCLYLMSVNVNTKVFYSTCTYFRYDGKFLFYLEWFGYFLVGLAITSYQSTSPIS